MDQNRRFEMEADNNRRLNRATLIFWFVMTVTIVATFAYEVKAGRVAPHPHEGVLMGIVAFLPIVITFFLYRKDSADWRIRYYIGIGHTIFYAFVMFNANNEMVFSYIIPIGAMLILYHDARLMMMVGIPATIINIVQIAMAMNAGMTALQQQNMRIQLEVLPISFAAAIAGTYLYDGVVKRNAAYARELEEKSEEIQQMTLQTIETIANTIDAKDEYTQGHSRRVSEYSARIAEYMNMSREDVMNIRYIALLHDVGKISVPDAVLNKPGHLTDEEYELMKQHTTSGGEILKDISMLPDLPVGAKYHHERYDGKGYPMGLKGEEIPLIARIICLADAYDAMTSNRIYRKHLPIEVVMDEIGRCSGTQFDPEVTKAFLRYMEDDGANELTEAEGEAAHEDNLAKAGNKLLEKIVIDRSRQSEKDELTGAFNRSSGERRIAKAMKEIEGTLVLMNVDNMRDINRQFSFRRGDYYIKTVASVIDRMDIQPIVCRFGGDEFLCYFKGVSEREKITAWMDEFRRRIDYTSGNDELIESLSVSSGIAIHDNLMEDVHDLLNRADKALYHVKQNLRGGYYYYDQLGIKPEEFFKEDLNDLIETIRRKDNYFSNEDILGKKDFTRMYNFVRDVAQANRMEVQLLMFTAKVRDNCKVSIEQREKVMTLVEEAILKTIQDENVLSRYSSVQRIVAVIGDITEAGHKDIHEVVDNVLTNFYRMYDKKDMELECEIGQLPINKESA